MAKVAGDTEKVTIELSYHELDDIRTLMRQGGNALSRESATKEGLAQSIFASRAHDLWEWVERINAHPGSENEFKVL